MKNKKKVGLLTIDPQIYNYGGILQEYALFKIINEMGYECELINYAPSNELNTFSYKRDIRNLTVAKIFEKIKEHENRHCKKNENKDAIEILKKRYTLFDDFRKRINISEPRSRAQLISSQNQYSSIVCGSDQIWNPDYNIPAFFLDFVNPPVKSIVYAASIGKTQLTKRQIKTYAAFMTSLDAISVRERSARELLANCVENTLIELVLDPTLILEKGKWFDIAEEGRKYPHPYIFCYFLENNEQKRDAALKFAEDVGCTLVSVPYLHGEFNQLDRDLGDISQEIGPAQFLNYIMNAEYVLTDSFHASVFSILFDKNFRVFGRISGIYNMNTRIDTLLSYFNLQQCMIVPKELKSGMPHICANTTKYEEMKGKSLNFLHDALG